MPTQHPSLCRECQWFAWGCPVPLRCSPLWLCFGAARAEPGHCFRNNCKTQGCAKSSRPKEHSGAVQGENWALCDPSLRLLCVIVSTRGLLFRQRRLSFLQQFPEITLGKCENLELLNLPGGRRAGGGWWQQEEGSPACWLPFILAMGPWGCTGWGEAHQPPAP